MLLEVVLRRFGNSIGVIIPPAVLRHQSLHPGVLMTLDASQDGKITLALSHKPTLSDLLARCDPMVDPPPDVARWNQLLGPAVKGGR